MVSTPNRSTSRRVVLLIDEDPATARLVRLSLHGPQCQVLVASRAVDGTRIAAEQHPDLVLLEVQFTNSNGVELVPALRQAGCVVAFLTRDASVVQHFRAIQLGALAYITKPVKGKRLGRVVERAFQRLGASMLPEPVSGPGADALLQTLQQLQDDAASGILTLSRPGELGQIAFNMGRVERATCGAQSAEDALSLMARHADWKVEFGVRGGDAAAKLAGRFVVSETSETDPTLPTLTERSTSIPWGGLAPEAALGPAGDTDDEHTVIDPTHPLLWERKTEHKPSEQKKASTQKSASVLRELTIPTVSETPLDHGSTTEEDLFEEDVPTPLQFTAAEDASVPTAPRPGVPRDAPSTGGHPGDVLQGWLQINRAPLLLVIPNEPARRILTRAAEQVGLTVLCVENGREAYSSAIQVRPVAILSDLKVPDMGGRELVGAIRTDFMVRETPFMMVSGEELATRVAQAGPGAADPILQGLRMTLMPRAQLLARLRAGESGELGGPLEPVGVGALLRILGAARATGRLRLRHGEQRHAELTLVRGEICGATVNAPQATVGPLALLNMVGLEWREFTFETRKNVDESQVSLGNLYQLLETACQQNNVLLSRVYKQGVEIDDVTVDKNALDLYLQTLPPDSLDVLIRVVEGEAAATLAAQGVASPNLLRSMVFELRRRSVIRPTSLRSVRLDALVEHPGTLPALPPSLHPRRGRRWLVVIAASLATAALAAGGYVVYAHYLR